MWGETYGRTGATDALDQIEIGREQGYAAGRIRRNRDAFREGGLDAVTEQAGRAGDMEQYGQAQQEQRTQRRFESDEQERQYRWFEQNAPYARNALRAARQRAPEQAVQFLSSPQVRARFEGMGFSAEQIDSALQALANPDAEARNAYYDDLDAAFSQYQRPDWTVSPVTGQLQAVDPNNPEGGFITGGASPDAPAIQERWNIETQDKRRDANQPYAGSNGGGGAAYSILSAEDAETQGLPGGRTYQRNNRTGQITTVGGNPPLLAGAEQRGRIILSYPNVIQAQQDMETLEAQARSSDEGRGSRNATPYGNDWGARVAEFVPFDGGTASRVLGGESYQQYEAASRSFEQSIMPAFSGSAVTESEAQRFVRANLPRLGDNPETLRRKAQNRARIINSAAVIIGEQPPYPDAGSWQPSTGLSRPQGAAGTPGAPTAPPQGGGQTQSGPGEQWERGPDGRLRRVR